MRYRWMLWCLLALLTACSVAQAQHLGSRQQWQPQTETDPRLQQPVQLEIIGRAAITGLPILSDKTGVTLAVAPEDLATVGERRFTVIAQGCTLKAILVQLCEALQECHWDVDIAGKEPAYLLHRNAGVDEQAAARAEAAVAARPENRRARCEERMEAARAALAMSPEELKKLEQSDLFLARGVRQPLMRAALEGLFSLSEEQTGTFLSTGMVGITYAEATPQLRHAAALALESMTREAEAHPSAGAGEDQSGPTLEEIAGWRRLLGRELPADTSLRFRGNSIGEIIMFLRAPAQPGISEWNGGAYVMLSRYPRFRHGSIAERLLVDTGDDEARAAETVAAWWQRGEAEREAERARRSRVEHGALPSDLDQLISVGSWEELSLPDFQQKVAAVTGLSVVSDWFSARIIYSNLQLPPEPVALSRALDRLALLLGFVWDVNGRCLTFHHTQWYDLSKSEAPESLIEGYREKLRVQGEFTLEDVVSLAVKLRERRPEPQGRGPLFALPEDLEETGLGSLLHGQAAWCVPLLAALTPDQHTQAETPEGLGFAGMSRSQQDEVLRRAENWFREKGDARARKARFRLRKYQSVADAHYYVNYQIELDFSGDDSQTLSTEVHLRGAEAPPEALPTSE